ncbi:hypothetical protein OKW49_000896 [Paraburkholderia youngii]
MLSGRRRSRTSARSRNRPERVIAGECCRSRKASPLARSGGESASGSVLSAPEKPHLCGEMRARGAFQRARRGSYTLLPKILTIDRTQSVRVADAGRVSGRSPGHSTTYVTQPPSSQRDGCNDWRLHETRFESRISSPMADRQNACTAARCLPLGLFRFWHGRLVAKEPPPRDSRKFSPFACRTRHDHSIRHNQ